jgi:regulator-associated protein of mTOR
VLQTYTQYIPLSVYELESWLGTPSIYVLDCSAAGLIVNALCEVKQFDVKKIILVMIFIENHKNVTLQRPEWGHSRSVASAMKDCILLAACGPNESLPQLAELPADLFTSCLTTPITIALRW